MVLLLSTSMVGFTSCSDDDDEEEGLDGAPYTGVWVMNYIKIEEDGEVDEGPITSEWGECTLTLSENGDYHYYALTHDDEEGEDEVVDESGTWSFAGDVLTLKRNDEYAEYESKLKVLTWTATKLVTYQSVEGYEETRTFVKR